MKTTYVATANAEFTFVQCVSIGTKIMLKLAKTDSHAHVLLQAYEDFKSYTTKNNNIEKFAFKEKLVDLKFNFHKKCTVLLVNSCIANDIEEEIKTLHFLMYLVGTSKIPLSSLKNIVKYATSCLDNSASKTFFGDNTLDMLDKRYPNFKYRLQRFTNAVEKKCSSPPKRKSWLELTILYLGLVMVLISIVILMISPDELARGMRQFPSHW